MTAGDGLRAVPRVTPHTTPPDQKGMCTCRNADVSGPTHRVSPSPLSTASVPPPSPCLLGAGPTGEEHLSSCVSLSSSAVPVLPASSSRHARFIQGPPQPSSGRSSGPPRIGKSAGRKKPGSIVQRGRAGHVCRGLVCGGRRHGDDHLQQCGRGYWVFLCEPRAAHPVGRGSRAQERHAATRRMGALEAVSAHVRRGLLSPNLQALTASQQSPARSCVFPDGWEEPIRATVTFPVVLYNLMVLTLHN